MTLDRVFATMHALVTGALTQQEAAARLYGGETSPDAIRLGLYRSSLSHKLDHFAETLFPLTRGIVLARIGAEGWSRLQHFLATEYPMCSARFAAAALVDLLDGPRGRELALPEWLAELADLELQERRIYSTKDVPVREGRLMAEPHVLRKYAHVEEQKAKVSQLRLALDETEIKAPFDGVVTGLNFEPGSTAHPGDVVARVVGGVGLRARIAVPDDAAEFVTRPRAKLTTEGRTLFATLNQVTQEVEPASRAFLLEGPVELRPEACGGDCAMLAGRTVRATLLRAGD